MVDYNSIGSDWDFTNSFDNTEVPVAKDNYFALEDLDNKKISIKMLNLIKKGNGIILWIISHY